MKQTGWKRSGWALGLLLMMCIVAHADSGVLIPGDKQAPDPAVLSLTEMQVEIQILNPGYPNPLPTGSSLRPAAPPRTPST